MAQLTRAERVRAVLSGQAPDRPPVGFWHHFPPDCRFGPRAVDAHLRHLSRFDLDFLKVMNDNPYPTRLEIVSPSQLRQLPVLQGNEEGFGRQLELIRSLRAQVGRDVWMTSTIFNSWAVLRRLVSPDPSTRHRPPTLRFTPAATDRRISELLAEDRAAVGMALDVIAASLAHFAVGCLQAGADGVFLSVRDDWVNTDANGRDAYDELVRTGDGQILTAARAARLNVLHVCGTPTDFEAFCAYPVHAINWADRVAGPSIADVADRIRPAVCAGVDNLATLTEGTPEDVANEVRDALRQSNGRPMIISPGCTYDPDTVPEANLSAMIGAVREHRQESMTGGH